MIQVILLLIKIIGIVLLVLLGVLLLLVTLLLFVPICYRIRLIYQPNRKEAYGRVSFLFPALCIRFRYLEKFEYQGSVFGFKILDSEAEPSEKKSRNKKSRKKKKVKETEPQITELQITEPQIAEPKMVSETDSEEKEAEKEKQVTHENGTEPKIGFFEKLRLKFKKISNTIDKIKGFLRKKDEIQRILQQSESRRAIAFVWENVKSLLIHILPRRIEGTILYGNSDPAVTGKILGAVSVLYAKIGPKLQFVPNFEQEQLETDVEVRGRVQVFALLMIAWRLFRNQELKQFISDIKKIKEIE